MLPGIGDVTAKNLVSYCGSVEAIFESSPEKLATIPGVGKKIAAAIRVNGVLDRAAKEVEFIQSNDIQPVFFLDEAYPFKLRYCNDNPVMLYYRGNVSLNHSPVVVIVGTRRATEYGREITEKIVEGLAPFHPLIVSGLAYGIDIGAHRAAVKMDLPTIAVLAHGLDRVYPGGHREIAEKMQHNGGLLTDYPSGTNPDRENFPQRNRIVAGMADVVVVVESAIRGGAVITANIANSYGREIFAVPGRIGDTYSEGCNFLVQTHKAAIFNNVEGMAENLGWIRKKEIQARQPELNFNLTREEDEIMKVLHQERVVSLDYFSEVLDIHTSKIAATLLEMEFKGFVKTLPGKRFKKV